jgi:23S rRNA (uridine2552-2'-O)-methyltransferase
MSGLSKPPGRRRPGAKGASGTAPRRARKGSTAAPGPAPRSRADAWGGGRRTSGASTSAPDGARPARRAAPSGAEMLRAATRGAAKTGAAARAPAKSGSATPRPAPAASGRSGTAAAARPSRGTKAAPASAAPAADAAAAKPRSGTAAPARSMKARAAAAKVAKRVTAAKSKAHAARPGAPARKSGAAPRSKSADTTQGARTVSVSLRTARGRTTAQQHWLQRQLNDPYVVAAQQQGWRSRAAFKLIELDDRFGLIRAGTRVLDLGAAPGGWCQVAIKRGAKQVVGLDLLPIDTVPGATLIVGDFTEESMPGRLMAALGGKVDLVLSDMAPNTTGHTATDHIRIVDLAVQALDFARQVLAPGGAFVAKVLQGGSEKEMMDSMRRDFAVVKHAKPPASRRESSELYVVATGFRGEG